MNQDMTQGRIFPVLARFALPMLVGDLFQQLYNIVDTIIVGRTLGADALAAVGATGTVMFLIVGVCTALANGFGVVTAQHFGARDADGVRRSFANGIYLITVTAAVLTLFWCFGCRPLLLLMNTPDNIFADSYAYISVIFRGLIVTALYNYFAANLRAIGNSRMPLLFLIFSSLLNVVLDLFFILALHMGVAGASTATVLSQLVSVLLCILYIMKKEEALQPHGGQWHINGSILKQQLIIGLPMGLQSAITASGTVIMQSATNIFGSDAVAAVTAYTKCRNLFTTVLMSTGNAMATFVGQNYGARDWKRVKEGVIVAVRFVVIYSLAAAVLTVALLPWEMKLFISDASTISTLMPWAKTAMWLSIPFFIPLGFIFLFRSALQASGHSVFAITAGIVELTSRIILAAIAIHWEIFAGACLCDSAAWFMAGCYTCISFCIMLRRSMRNA